MSERLGCGDMPGTDAAERDLASSRFTGRRFASILQAAALWRRFAAGYEALPCPGEFRET